MSSSENPQNSDTIQPTEQVPHIDIELSIETSSHSFTQQLPPTLTAKITSPAKHPITIVTWETPLDLNRALTNNGIIITDTKTEEVVKTSRILIQGTWPSRIRGTTGEKYFPTLEPNTPLVFSTSFGRGSRKPQPKAIAERGWEIDENGQEMKTRRSIHATGVDGLEPGHQYRIGLNLEAFKNCRWAFASKDEVLVDHPGMGSDMDGYPWNRTSLDFSVSETLLDVME